MDGFPGCSNICVTTSGWKRGEQANQPPSKHVDFGYGTSSSGFISISRRTALTLAALASLSYAGSLHVRLSCDPLGHQARYFADHSFSRPLLPKNLASCSESCVRLCHLRQRAFGGEMLVERVLCARRNWESDTQQEQRDNPTCAAWAVLSQ